jgi:hypothetical protein
MNTALGVRSSGWFARFSWQHPQWWIYILSALSWWVMLAHAQSHGAHAHHHQMPPALEAWHWLLMIGAMMLPLQSEQLRWVAFRSYAKNRQPALVAYVLGYLAVWLLAGLPVIAFRSAAWTHTYWSAAAGFGIAALWAVQPRRERAALACHYRRGLVPRGLAGLADTARFGGQIGANCALTCWPLMFACAVTGHGAVAMLAGTIIATYERFAFRPSRYRNALGPALLAAFYALSAR